MSALSRDELMRVHASLAARKLQHAGETLARRQSTAGPHRGNVPAWAGCEDLDFHGTLVRPVALGPGPADRRQRGICRDRWMPPGA